jgi:hypothetical protein
MSLLLWNNVNQSLTVAGCGQIANKITSLKVKAATSQAATPPSLQRLRSIASAVSSRWTRSSIAGHPFPLEVSVYQLLV